ncbi:MAG: DoxX family protein [Actinomycetes bacterium]
MSNVASALPARRVRKAAIGLWVVQVLLASQFVPAGLVKLSGDPAMVDMFAEIGAGQWFRYLVGALEIAGALGLLVPRLCGLAALGLTGLMAGAILTNLAVLHESPLLPAAYLLVAAFVAWPRRSQLASRIGAVRGEGR